MKAKLPPLVVSPRRHADHSGHAHHASRPHSVAKKTVDRHQSDDKGPRSTEESKSDGNAFREALFGAVPPDQPGVSMQMDGFGDSGGQSRQGGGHQDRRGGRQTAAVEKAAGVRKAQDAAQADELAASDSAATGWMELEVESRVAGKMRLSVLKEAGVLRARLSMSNSLAAQWMQAHLPDVEAQLTEELGCKVRLEMS